MSRKFSKFEIPKESASQKKEEYLQEITNKNWKNAKLIERGAESYLNELRISDIVLDLSFRRDIENRETDPLVLYSHLFNAIGVVLTNIDDATVTLGSVHLQQHSLPLSIAKEKIIGHYKRSAINSILPVLGSINIIGNPNRLIKTLGTGLQDFVDKPLDRTEQEGNVISLGEGLAEGTGSLVRHTVSGAFGSVHSITQALADGTGALTMDKRYQRERMKLQFVKTKGLLDSLNKGMNQFGFSVKDSFKGVFTKPVEMGRTDGALGALKGTVAGITGLVTKPVTGLFDAASTATGGVSRGALANDEQPNEERIRPPRPFYEDTRYIKPYNKFEARVTADLEDKFDLNRPGLVLNTEVYDEREPQIALNLTILPNKFFLTENITNKTRFYHKKGSLLRVNGFGDRIELAFYDPVLRTWLKWNLLHFNRDNMNETYRNLKRFET